MARANAALTEQRWEEQGDDYERPVFYAACRSEDGILVLTGWEDALAHRAFWPAHRASPRRVGMRHPDSIERFRIEKLGWD